MSGISIPDSLLEETAIIIKHLKTFRILFFGGMENARAFLFLPSRKRDGYLFPFVSDAECKGCKRMDMERKNWRIKVWFEG